MTVQLLRPDEVVARSVALLGLDPDLTDLASPEGLCASLRRAASLLCPATPRQLVDAVTDVLRPLYADLERIEVAEALEALVGIGDLLELRASDVAARLLFLAPPAYVEKRVGSYLLIGIRPGARPLVDEEALGAAIAYEGHTRTIALEPALAETLLASSGLHELALAVWARAPRQEASSVVIEQARARLASARSPGPVEGLTVLDASASVFFYRGRWREPQSSDEGMAVGRRPQAYGAPIWCLVDLQQGVPTSVLDLPLTHGVAPGWDEARRIQAALDAERGSPQLFRLRSAAPTENHVIFDFFGPLPSWADRYLDLAGLPVIKSPGALFSYCIPLGAVDETRRFLTEALWMQQTTEKAQDT